MSRIFLLCFLTCGLSVCSRTKRTTNFRDLLSVRIRQHRSQSRTKSTGRAHEPDILTKFRFCSHFNKAEAAQREFHQRFCSHQSNWELKMQDPGDILLTCTRLVSSDRCEVTSLVALRLLDVGKISSREKLKQ